MPLAERQSMNWINSSLQCSIPASPYRALEPGTSGAYFNHVKLLLAYRHHHIMLNRYANVEADATIVDIGCGPGYFLSLLKNWYPQANLVGLDYDLALLEEARARVSNLLPTHTSLLQADAERLPLDNDTIDLAITLHMVEHLHAPELFIAEIKRALGPRGLLLLATPNPSGIGARLMDSRWSGYRYDHIALKDMSTWCELLESAGFEILERRTTGLSGVPAFRQFPLCILNWSLLALFGSFRWRHGEAILLLARKVETG
jgi:SAM-dependent methyltransferase